MKIKKSFFFLFSGILIIQVACSGNKYGLEVPQDPEYYLSVVEKNPNHELVDLETYIPGIALDIRYATTNNFTGTQVYSIPKAFARVPVAEALKRIHEELDTQGLGLKIYDAYRPYRATVQFYETYEDTTYVASPYRGSRHNRGCAVDLTLVDRETGEELLMPTAYDDFTERAHADYPLEEGEAKANRDLLISIMEKHGFKVYRYEWWHFDFEGWEEFELLDISFEDLVKSREQG